MKSCVLVFKSSNRKAMQFFVTKTAMIRTSSLCRVMCSMKIFEQFSSPSYLLFVGHHTLLQKTSARLNPATLYPDDISVSRRISYLGFAIHVLANITLKGTFLQLCQDTVKSDVYNTGDYSPDDRLCVKLRVVKKIFVHTIQII